MTALLLASIIVRSETPEKTVQDFVAAVNAHDPRAMAMLIVGDDSATPIPGLEEVTLRAKLRAVKIEGDTASVEADVELALHTNPGQKAHETIGLRRVMGDWRIVPADPFEPGGSKDRYLGFLAFCIGHPESLSIARSVAKRAICLSNVKQLALGTLIYAIDHSDALPKSGAVWKTVVRPYVRSEKVFHCPDDSSGEVSYFLEPRLAGKSTVSIARPSETAMIIEGSVKKTAFRHQGSAAIGFVDGHAWMSKPDRVLAARTVPLR